MIGKKPKMEIFAIFLVVSLHCANGNSVLRQNLKGSENIPTGHRLARDAEEPQESTNDADSKPTGIFYRRGDKILECFPNGECEVVDVIVPDDDESGDDANNGNDELQNDMLEIEGNSADEAKIAKEDAEENAKRAKIDAEEAEEAASKAEGDSSSAKEDASKAESDAATATADAAADDGASAEGNNAGVGDNAAAGDDAAGEGDETSETGYEATADGGDASTADGGDGSTAGGGDGSTAGGGDGSTADGGDGSTADGGDGSTADGGDGSTADGSYGSTADGGDASTADVGDASTEDGGDVSTADGGDVSTADGGDASTADGGDASTADRGDASTADGGDGSTADGGDGSTADGGDGSTADGGDASTADGGDGSTADESDASGDGDASAGDAALGDNASAGENSATGGNENEGGSGEDEIKGRNLGPENNNAVDTNQPNGGIVTQPDPDAGSGGKAVCEFKHSSKVEGSILLIEEFSQSPMEVLGKLKGLNEGTYVLTFHAKGDVESGACRGIGPFHRPAVLPFHQKLSKKSKRTRRSRVRSRRGIDLFKLGKKYMVQAYESCIGHVDLCQNAKLSKYTCKMHLDKCTEVLKCKSCRENAKAEEDVTFETLEDLEKTAQVEYKTDIPRSSLTVYADDDGLANIAEVEKEQTIHGKDSVIGRSILISAVPKKPDGKFKGIACCRIEAGGPAIIT